MVLLYPHCPLWGRKLEAIPIFQTVSEEEFSEVSSAPPNSQARLLSSSRCFARSAARLTAMVAKMTMSVTMTA
jgi:hypothetical protein